MELTSCLGNFSKPDSSHCGNNFSFIWIILLLFLLCGDGFDSILGGFGGLGGCKKKKRRCHHKRKCNDLLGEDSIFIILIVVALFFCNNNNNEHCC
jgi:hypothetical protein